VLRPSRQAGVVGGFLLIGAVCASLLAARSRYAVVDASFWFEPVTYDASEAMAPKLGGAITAPELESIAKVARGEITRAFGGFRITFSDQRDASYRVRVVQDLKLPVAPKYPGPSGVSRAVGGFGGQGAVSFRTLANNAIAYSPEGAGRAEVIAAIGRGIGRAAVHEFAHQLLGAAPIDASQDVQSYEYRTADRREQYYGPARWDIALPMLEKRVGRY
jgi:hypothetical protein